MPVNESLAKENFEHYIYARDNGHLKYVKKAKQCEDYFEGVHWEEIVKQRLENVGRPALTINKIIATIATILGEQLDNRADISFLPSANGLPMTAEALTKVFIQIANENKLDWLESEVFADGIITSRGFFDVRIAFGDQMQGEVDIKLLNPKNVVIDADAEEYDPDTWKEVFITKWMAPNDIAVLYNKADSLLLRDRAVTDFMNNYDSVTFGRDSFGGFQGHPVRGDGNEDKDIRRKIRVLERQHKKLRRAEHFVDLRTGDTRVIPETWTQKRIGEVAKQYELGVIEKLSEHIRWTVTADNIVLFDEWSAYKYFTPVPYFPFFRRGTTIGLVENLLGPQDQLNKASSQELHVINTTANSGWKIKENSLKNMDEDELESRGAQTGLVMVLDDVNNAEKINPNQIPTGLDRVSAKSDEHIKEISGISDSSRGFDRADVAAKAIQAKASRGSINIAKPMDNLARTRHMLAERSLALVQAYYTEERIIQVTKGGVDAQTSELVVNQANAAGEIVNDLTVGEYDVIVTTVPARSTFDDSQFQEAVQMRDMGIPIPDAVLVEYSRLTRKSEIAQEIRDLTGGEATEAERQLQQLEVQLKQADLASSNAESQRKTAEAQLATVRAQKTQQDIEQEAGGNSEEEARAQDLLIQREKIASDAQIQREKIDSDLTIAREKMRQESLIKRAEAVTRIEGGQASG